MIQFITSLSRRNKQAIMLAFDAISIIFIIFASFWIRLGYFVYPSGNEGLLMVIYASPLLAMPIFTSFGLYREVIRFVGFKTLWNIIQASSIYAMLWGLMVFMANIEDVPRSVILINWVLLTLVIGSSRLFARWLFSEATSQNSVVIYGAGSAGRQLLNALRQSKEYNPIAFIDDSTSIHNTVINGLRVYPPNNLKNLIDTKDVKAVLIAMPSLKRSERQEIISFLELYKVEVRSVPGVAELAQGKVKVNDLLEIDLSDLLGRDSVMPNKELFEKNISNKVVMVTGAGGSIGSELCRQIVLLKPKMLVLYELSEPALYQIDQELKDNNEFNIEVCPILGSVTDKDRALKIFEYYGVQTVYHAAAYKHVPLVEYNHSQGVFNNTIGTKLLAEAAIASNLETFVLISTDKAVRPTNYMGASKRAAEMVLQAFAEQTHNTCFTMVRFGNVLDSSGSVIPLFKKQIKEGGPLTVTHPDIVRYFMMIPEAVELVIQAGAMAEGGEVFVLDMGEPVRIYDLAVKIINLSGLELLDENNPKGDIEIQFTGLRPGEKLYEELLIDGKFSLTGNKLIMRTEEGMMPWDKLEPILTEIHNKGTYTNTEELYKLIKKIVPEFKSK
ncbi:polysaccharide biosynthesis protein [Candidatus Pseudothioglobus singularis]|nr:nucleoside-diphosphate sugar epimerase/dehydratase [Candidatus Pseudothioglobus singularis]MDB4822124.1 polysaccharide biosynthesis protein [Candidatus Pseudothioglobus singularis]